MSRRQDHKTRRRARAARGILPDDLYAYIDEADGEAVPPVPAKNRPADSSLAHWTVSDDWPERVPVTDAEIDLFEAWFGDILDELFGKSA